MTKLRPPPRVNQMSVKGAGTKFPVNISSTSSPISHMRKPKIVETMYMGSRSTILPALCRLHRPIFILRIR